MSLPSTGRARLVDTVPSLSLPERVALPFSATSPAQGRRFTAHVHLGGVSRLLVEAVTSRWGQARTESGKVVWFEVDT